MPSVQETQFSELIARFYPLIDALRGSMTNVQNLVSLLTTAGGQWWRNRADMDVGPQPPEGTPAIVWNDPVVANRGLYVRLGDPLTGSWEPTGYIFGSSVPLALLDPDVFESFRADVTQVIGRTGVPVAGNPVAGSAYIQAAPVAHASPLARLPVKLVAPGNLMVARYIVSADQTQIRRQETAVIPVADIGDGNKVFTQTHFGVINFNPGDLIGLSGAGMFTASPDFPVDGPGWRQINPLLDDWRPMPALQAAIRLEYSAEFDQHVQVVNGPDFLATKAQAADVDARATVLEEQAARLWTDRVQVIGNPDELVLGDPVADGMYVWANPNEHVGPLLSLDVMPAAAGDFQLAKWYQVGTKIYRNLLLTLHATTAGVEQRFTPADFGNIVVAEGEHLAVHGLGVISATTETADGLGYWDVNAYATPRDIPALQTTHRLQARFRIQQQYQAVDADAVLELDDRVTEIEQTIDAAVGTPLFDGAMLISPDWQSLTKADFKSPLRGGLLGQTLKRNIGRRTLAHLATVADTYNGAALGHTNVANDKAFCGASSLRLHVVGTSAGTVVPTAPAAANAVPVDVRGGIIQFDFRPVLNVGTGMDRWWIELHSPGSTPDNPSVNHHRIPISSNSWLKGLLTSIDGAGRNQSSAIPVSCFTANGAGADLTAITWARFMTRAANGQAIDIEYGNISWVPNPLSKGKLIWCVDDGYIEQFTQFAPWLTKRGFRGMIYPSPPAHTVDVSGTYGNRNQLITLQDRLGWQVAGQAYSDEGLELFQSLDRNGKVAEFAKLMNWRIGGGFVDGAHGSYFSNVDMRYLPIVDAMRIHFRSVRGYFPGNYDPLNPSTPPFVFPEVYPWGDPMNIRALAGSAVTNANHATWLTAHIQQAVTHKGVAKIVFHKEWVGNANIQAGILAGLDYADQHRADIEVCTESDLHFGYAA